MDPRQISAMVEGLKKLAYGVDEHTGLARRSASTMGVKPKSAMGDLLTRGSLDTDKGIRHPWNPANAKHHAMPGQSRIGVLRGVAKQRKAAVQDVAKSIAKPGPLAGARATRGMMNLGQAQHTYMDVSAHHGKPLEMSAGSAPGNVKQRSMRKVTEKLRTVAPKIPGGGGQYLGAAISGMEHEMGGMDPSKGMHGAHLDRLKPKTYAADKQALNHAQSFGRSTQRKMIQELTKSHGMSPQQAEQALQQYMSNAAPGRTSQFVGRASRNVGHLKGQASGAKSALLGASRLAGRLLLRR